MKKALSNLLVVLIFVALLPLGVQADSKVSKPPRPRPVSTKPGLPCSPRDWISALDTGVKSVCKNDGSAWEDQAMAAGGVAGDVTGPASAVDNHLVVFNGTSGKLVRDGGAIPSATPAGSDKQVQFNDGGSAFGGVAQFTFAKPAAAETGKVSISGTALGTNGAGDGAVASEILNVAGPAGQATSFNNNLSKGGNGSGVTIVAGDGGANSDVNTNSSVNHRGGLGGSFTMGAGNGGAGTTAPGVVRGATGGSFSFSSGNGGTAVNAIAGNGGGFTFQAGNGGVTTAAAASGNGGSVSLTAGTGGANSNAAGTTGNGGTLTLDAGGAGFASGGAATGTKGSVSIGTGNALTINLGNASSTTTIAGILTQTSNSATAFESGPNGGTNPVLRLVNNTASQADGVSITGGAAGNGTTFTGLSSGATSGFTFTPKGSPTANFLLSSGRIQIGGTSSSFPALRNSGAVLDAVLADGSAFAAFKALTHSMAGAGKFGPAVSDGIIPLTNEAGTAGTGWLITGEGNCFLQADQTNATTTFASINNCTVNVTSGRRYSFVAVFYLSDSTAADGAKIDFNGGAATSTNFRVHCTAFDSALNLSSQGTALSTAYAATTFTGAGIFECHGTFEPSSSSTFIPRFAQNAHTAGTLTLARGSNMKWKDHGP